MPPDEPNDEENLEKLPQDNETPFRPAEPSEGEASTIPPESRAGEDILDSTHPATDTNLQPEEAYDEGISGAAEASEPKPNDDVISYDRDKDTREKPG